MATWRTAADGKGRSTLRAPLRRLRDEILDLYLDWREQAAAAEDAYESWAGAPAGEEGRWFAVYLAALDREEARRSELRRRAGERRALVGTLGNSLTHRDVSPGNVLTRRSDGGAKLSDFGLACRAGVNAPKSGGDAAGTYRYMAPEVPRGVAVTSLSDLYSRGALAYWLLAGPAEPRRTATADGAWAPLHAHGGWPTCGPSCRSGVAEPVDRARA